MTQKYIVFDIWSFYGHFKKPYTTTSPLTYSIPTRTALIGMVAAILGLEKGSYAGMFNRDEACLGLSIINPVKKVRISENFINTKLSMIKIHERTQIKIEFLKDPRYRVYFKHLDTKIHEGLKSLLEKHRCVYTPCMGLSENIANFDFIGEFDGKTVVDNKDWIHIKSVIPASMLRKDIIEFENDKEYFTEKIPVVMDNERNVKEYGEVMFERTGKSIKTSVGNFVALNNIDENIVMI